MKKNVTWLDEPVYNDALILFRIFFGLIMFCEALYWVFSGHLSKYVIDPVITFPFFGFAFLDILRGDYMYLHFTLMAVFALFIMVGKYTKYFCVLYTLFFASFYFIQKTFYNNHYYLTLLLSALLCLVPANAKWSFDALKKGKHDTTCPRWCLLLFALQMLIVYTFAAINKLYSGWLSGDAMRGFLDNHLEFPLIGGLFDETWFILFSSYFAIFFDGFVVYLLLWRKTRVLGIVFSLLFHLFNSFVFQVGSFPYLALVLALFFIPHKTVHFWTKKIQLVPEIQDQSPKRLPKLMLWGVVLYFSIQIALPLRHHFIEGDVLYSQEGHRLSWRMMLRGTSGETYFRIETPGGAIFWYEKAEIELSKEQYCSLGVKPDFIYAYVQRIKKDLDTQGYHDYAIYAVNRFSVNGKEAPPLVDPHVGRSIKS